MVLQYLHALWKEFLVKITIFLKLRSIAVSYITWVLDLQHVNLLKKYPFIVCVSILHASLLGLF